MEDTSCILLLSHRPEPATVKDLPWKLFAGIVVLWLVVGILPYTMWRDLHNASDFANTFGFANALFAALAFGGVIWAIRLQTHELELQRLEIEETRDELRRAADAQHQSQEMHFLAALLTARNSVAQGYAAAAARETGSLRVNEAAHRQQLMELEWLLQLVDKHASNPFAVAGRDEIIRQQVRLLLSRSQPILQTALSNRATNHVRALLLEMNQTLRELCRLTPTDEAHQPLKLALELAIQRAESASHACEFDEVGSACEQVFNGLAREVGGDHGSVLLPRDVLASRSSPQAIV